MPEVTVEDVLGVYSKVPPQKYPEVEVAIKTASLLVKQSIVDNGCGANYTEEQIKTIIVWLSAHVYQIQTGVISSLNAGSSSESYQMTLDKMLLGTLHAQNAMLLDPNHCLAQLMADTDQALQGRQSYPPSMMSLHSYKQRGVKRYTC